MGLYRKFVIPRLTNWAMRNSQLGPYRERVIGASTRAKDFGSAAVTLAPLPIRFTRRRSVRHEPPL